MPDIEKTRELQKKIMQDIAAGSLIPVMRIGDELGLFKKLFKFGPCTYTNFSKKINLDERYIKEWLLSLSASGYISYEEKKKHFFLTPEQFAILGDENSDSLMIGGFENLTGAVHNIEKIKENFKNGGGTDWGALHPCCLSGSARFFKPAYSIFLTRKWIPSLDGAEEILNHGGKFADIGCGHGYSSSIIAETYKNCFVTGIDSHKPSIIEAKKFAQKKKLNNINFQVASSKDFKGNYDIIGFFDCLHDMGDPVNALKYAKSKLKKNGLIFIVEPTASDNVVENFNLIGQMYYSFSTIACIPASKSQEVGLALGAQAGPKKISEILRISGFKNIKITFKTASNMVIQAKHK